MARRGAPPGAVVRCDRRSERRAAGIAVVGARFLKLFQAGCRPKRKVAVEAFYLLILPVAERARDAQTYAEALGALRTWLEAQGASTQVLRPFEERLSRLQSR